jgi:N-acetylglutamate synthase-like GNAT family acetyltransferase
VDYYHRKKGTGKKLLNYIIGEAKKKNPAKPIYGVTSIPNFPAKCGFRKVSDYPAELERKRKTCFINPEKAVIMKYAL